LRNPKQLLALSEKRQKRREKKLLSCGSKNKIIEIKQLQDTINLTLTLPEELRGDTAQKAIQEIRELQGI
jgi:hypothetical protein